MVGLVLQPVSGVLTVGSWKARRNHLRHPGRCEPGRGWSCVFLCWEAAIRRCPLEDSDARPAVRCAWILGRRSAHSVCFNRSGVSVDQGADLTLLADRIQRRTACNPWSASVFDPARRRRSIGRSAAHTRSRCMPLGRWCRPPDSGPWTWASLVMDPCDSVVTSPASTPRWRLDGQSGSGADPGDVAAPLRRGSHGGGHVGVPAVESGHSIPRGGGGRGRAALPPGRRLSARRRLARGRPPPPPRRPEPAPCRPNAPACRRPPRRVRPPPRRGARHGDRDRHRGRWPRAAGEGWRGRGLGPAQEAPLDPAGQRLPGGQSEAAAGLGGRQPAIQFQQGERAALGLGGGQTHQRPRSVPTAQRRGADRPSDTRRAARAV
jgi:hypothetical protein